MKSVKWVALLVVLLLAGPAAQQRPATTARPASSAAGFSAERLARLDVVLQQYVVN